MKIYKNNKTFLTYMKDKIMSMKPLVSRPIILNLNEYTSKQNNIIKLKPINYVRKTLTWTSSNENIATVDNSGIVTTLTNDGVTTITCSDGQTSDTCNVTVKAFNYIDSDLDNVAYKIICSNFDTTINNVMPMYIETLPTIDGIISKIDNEIILDGTQSIATNGIAAKHGFGVGATIGIQIYRLCIEFTAYPTNNTLIFPSLSITSNGSVLIKDVNSNVKIPLNKKIVFCFLCGNITNYGWHGRVFLSDGQDSGNMAGSVIWGTDFTISKGIKAKISEIRIINCSSIIKSVDSITNEFKQEMLEQKFIYSTPAIVSQTRTIEQDISLNLEFKINLKDNNKYKYKNKSEGLLDLEEIDEFGYITNIHPLALNYGENTISVNKKYNIPKRYYKSFRIKDKYNNDYIYPSKISICNSDSSITSNDTIAKYMYISPDIIQCRVGDFALVQPTFIPFKIANPRCIFKSSNEKIAIVDNSGLITCIGNGICTITATSLSNPALSSNMFLYIDNAINESEICLIDLNLYQIVKDSPENGLNNTRNINNALKDIKSKGYLRAKLPEGTYYMDTNESNESIRMISDFEFDITNCTIIQNPCAAPDTRIIMCNRCDNSKIIGGTIIGDRYTHNYGIRLNENPGTNYENSIWEIGAIDHRDGVTLVDKSTIDGTAGIRSKNYMTNFPSKPFRVTPLWKTSTNTVDGGRAILYWYDANNNFISYKDTGFLNEHTPPTNATKLKIVIRSEQRLDAVYTLTDRTLHYTYEFGTGIAMTDVYNCEINGTTILDCQGDCAATFDTGYAIIGKTGIVNEGKWINCTLENSRRQGISFVASGENYLIKNTNIGRINGVDPQCGVDFEGYSRMEKFLFDNCYFYDNRKWDMVDCFSGHIEVRNSRFNGAIALNPESYNWYVHNNDFVYADKFINEPTSYNTKIHNFVGDYLTFTRSPYVPYSYMISENNNYDGKSPKRSRPSVYNPSATTAIAYGHTLTNSDYSLKSSVGYKFSLQNSGLYLTQSQLYDSIINNSFASGSGSTLYNCILNDSSLGTDIVNSTLNEHSIGGNGVIKTYKDCIINNKTKDLSPGYGVTFTLDNCNITIPKKFHGYNYTPKNTFKNCTFKFTPYGEVNKTNDFIGHGYGETKCFIIYENCHFESISGYPININSSYLINCTKNEFVTFPNSINITNFTIGNNYTLLATKDVAIDMDSTIIISPTNASAKNVIIENDGGSGAVFDYNGRKITFKNSGNFTITLKTVDGTNITKMANIVVSA